MVGAVDVYVLREQRREVRNVPIMEPCVREYPADIVILVAYSGLVRGKDFSQRYRVGSWEWRR
jgi:hypothetical protein